MGSRGLAGADGDAGPNGYPGPQGASSIEEKRTLTISRTLRRCVVCMCVCLCLLAHAMHENGCEVGGKEERERKKERELVNYPCTP